MSNRPSVPLQWLEHLLPARQPLAGRWWQWECLDCGRLTKIDARLGESASVRWLRDRGVVLLKCTRCGSAQLQSVGPLWS